MGRPTNKQGKAVGKKGKKNNRNNKVQEGTKPKRAVQRSTKVIKAAAYKNKTSSIKRTLARGNKSNGKGILTGKQITQRKTFAQYAMSAKKIKQLRREGVPMKVIQQQIYENRKKENKKRKKQTKKVGLND